MNCRRGLRTAPASFLFRKKFVKREERAIKNSISMVYYNC